MIEGLLGDWVMRVVVAGILVLVIATLALAAVALQLRLRNRSRERRWQELEARWTPVLLDILAGEQGQEDLFALVAPADARAFIGFLKRFAVQVRGTEWKTVRELAQPFLPELAASVDGMDAERRARAIQTLGELGMPEHEDALLAALEDDSPLVAMVAARRLFRPGNEQHFHAVFAQLPRFSLWSTGFLSAMFAAGGAEVAPMLRDIAADSGRQDFERIAALDALRVLHDSSSAEPAIGLLQQEASPGLRVAALRLLQAAGRKTHAGTVRPFLESDDAAVRRAAVRAIGALGDPSDVSTLVQLLDDASPWVRIGAAGALADLGAREELLLAAAEDGPRGQAAREVVSG